MGFGIGFESSQAVNEARARNGIATDANTRGHANALGLKFIQRLVGERSRTAHDADVLRARHSLLGDVARGDTNVGFSGANDAGTVRAEQTNVGEIALEFVEEPGFVVRRDAFGNAHDKRDSAFGSFHHRRLHTGRRDENTTRGRASSSDRVGNVREHRDAIDIGTSLLRVRSTDHLRAIGTVQRRVVLAL